MIWFYPRWHTCSRSIIETLEKGVKYVQSVLCSICSICSGVFIVNFEHTSPLFLVFLLLTLNKYILAGKTSLNK